MQDIKCTIAQQSLDFETKEKIKARGKRWTHNSWKILISDNRIQEKGGSPVVVDRRPENKS